MKKHGTIKTVEGCVGSGKTTLIEAMVKADNLPTSLLVVREPLQYMSPYFARAAADPEQHFVPLQRQFVKEWKKDFKERIDPHLRAGGNCLMERGPLGGLVFIFNAERSGIISPQVADSLRAEIQAEFTEPYLWDIVYLDPPPFDVVWQRFQDRAPLGDVYSKAQFAVLHRTYQEEQWMDHPAARGVYREAQRIQFPWPDQLLSWDNPIWKS